MLVKRISVILVCLVLVMTIGCQTSNETVKPSQSPSDDGQSSGGTDLSGIKANIRIGTASLGSTGQVLGTAYATVISKYLPSIRVSALTTQGSIEDVRLLEQKEVEIAFINGDAAYAAFHGLPPFDHQIVNYQMFSQWNNQCVFVTLKNSGIKTIEDLKGKRVSVGPPGSGGLDLATSVLKGYGLWDEVEKVYLAYTDQAEALKDGTIDAMMAHLNSRFPASYFAELDATSDDIYIIGQSEEGIKKIQELQPFQMVDTLVPGEHIKNLDREILTMTNYSVCYARPDIPEDVVYAFMKTLFEHANELDAYHVQGQNIRKENAVKGFLPEVPVHPGAAKYLKEQGLWDDSLIIGEIKG